MEEVGSNKTISAKCKIKKKSDIARKVFKKKLT